MRSTRNRLIGGVLLVAFLTLVVWGFLAKRKEAGAEAERERPVKAPSRITVEQGETVVFLDPATQEKSGVAAAPLRSAVESPKRQAYGTVVTVQELLDQRNSYVAAQARAEKASADSRAARREYDRLGVLNADEKNVSDRALESARAAAEGAEAAEEAAATALRVTLSGAKQRWGETLATWIASSSSSGPLDRLSGLQDVLLQVSIPLDVPMAVAPRTVSLSAPAGRLVTARLAGTAPRTDPRIQGRLLFYLAAGQGTGLVSGLNVPVYLPSGHPVPGVIVPASAVVWSAGDSWVYLEKRPGRFVRRPVSTDSPIEGGWFVTKGFAGGDRLVVAGAQLLLSEEFRSQLQVGKEGRKKK